MKIAVCVPSSPCDCYGHLSHYADKIAHIGMLRGIDVEVLRYTDASFSSRLFANLSDKNCIVHFHCFLYDLAIHGVGAPRYHALEGSVATTLATISDHPFSDYMSSLIRNAHPSTRFIVVDKTFEDEMRFINPSLCDTKFAHLPFVPPVNFDRDLNIPFCSRSYDLVIPMYLMHEKKLDLAVRLANFPDGWLKKAAFATFEAALTDTSRNTFHVFAEKLGDELEGATLDDFRRNQPKAIPGLLSVLDSVDGIVRHRRRHDMVRGLLRSVGNLKVAVMGDAISSLNADKNVEFVGKLQTAEATKIMADSRAILNCNPTYPHNIHERVSVGMLNESCVITDVNPCISEIFSRDEFIPYSPQSAETIADIFEHQDVYAVGRAAAAKVQAMSVFSWDAHFDGILAAATS